MGLLRKGVGVWKRKLLDLFPAFVEGTVPIQSEPIRP